MISLGLLFAVAVGAGAFVPQLVDGDPVAGLACADAPVAGVVQSAGPPTTELMAMGERPGRPLRDLVR